MAHFETYLRVRLVCIQPDGGFDIIACALSHELSQTGVPVADSDTHTSAQRPCKRLRQWPVDDPGRVLQELR